MSDIQKIKAENKRLFEQLQKERQRTEQISRYLPYFYAASAGMTLLFLVLALLVWIFK